MTELEEALLKRVRELELQLEQSQSGSVPKSIIFGQSFKVRTKTFDRQYQQSIITLKKNGIPNRLICKELHIGNDYYQTVASIIQAYQEQVGEL